uniref:Mediator of DNA damage checkpoint protein 1 n=1 Tax=Castor canadensis TaxID=51338 RepID=A0A8B7VHD4_CASCN|nr:mediator of DNA damage checkpoint protein 1 isoform X5 [Castor canadensis]
MEDTQIIDWDIEEEETEQSSESLGDSLEPVGQLRIFSGTHGPEKDFPLYLGKNVIGRSPECTVALPFPSISKQHAVIEILAWNKAPILQDCGSLNGTQILRPPKVLSPGVSHRLRDKELILFADFPCQYHRLDIPLSFVSRGPLTVEETPRVQGGTQPSRLMLAEDSEEEVDFLSERNVVKESRTTSSPLPTVVPESDEEGPSLAPGDSGPSFSGNLESDTDEEKDEQPAVGEASSATRKGTAVKAEKPEADRVIINIRLVKARSSVQRPKDSRVKRDAGDGVGPVGVILERRSQPPEEDSDTDMDEECRPPGRPAVVCLERAHSSSFMGSDTDVEEETIPVTPAIVPMKKKQIFHGVGTRGTESPGLAYLQMSLAGNDTDVKEGEAPLTVPLEGSQTSMVINSDTDDEEEVSAALTLARLKESGAVLWNRDTYVEEGRAQPVALLEQSQTASGRDSDTDMEEEWLPREKRETVPSSHTDENGTIVTAQSEKVQPPLGNSDSEEADVSSPGIHLERSQASSATVGNNTEVEEVVPLGPAVIHLEKNQVSVEGTNETDVEAEEDSELLVVPLKEAWPPDEDWETDVEEDRSSTGTNVRKSQLWAEGDTKTEQATAVLEQESALEMGAQGGSPVAQVEQVVVHPGTLGEPILAQRKGVQIPTGRERKAHRGVTKDSKDSCDGHLNCMMPPAEKASWGAPESPDACLPPAVPEASAPPQRPFTSQSPNHPVPQPLLPPSPPSSEPPISRTRHNRSLEISETPPSSELEAFHPKHNIRPRRRSSRMTPSPLSSTPTTPTDQPITPEPTSQATWGRTRRSSVKTLESVVPIATKLHPSTSTVQPVIPKCLSRVTRGKTNRFSVKIPEPVVPTGPELHPSTSTVQPVIPEPTTQASRGRTRRSSVNSPESVVPTASHLQPSISTDHPVTSKRTSRASRGRTNKSSVKTLEPVVPTGSELHPSISTDHPVTPKPTSRVTWGRTNRSSVKTPEPVVPTGPELQLSTSAVQSVTPKPMTRAAWGRACKSSIETPKSVEPKTPDLEPPGSTDQPVIPEAVAQHETVKSLSLSSAPVLTAPQFQSPIATAQPVSLEPIPQASCSRRQRAARKHSSLTPPISNKLPSAPPQPKSRSLRIQRQGALRAAESLGTIPEPSFPQCPELPTHAPQIQKVKVAGTSGFTPEPQPKASQIRKRSSATMDSPPLQKRSQREVSQKTVFPKEEEDAMERPRKEEDVVIPGPGKRKRDQAEEKSKGIPSRGLRRTKPNQESAAPKVLFTGIMDARGERAVLALGGSLAGSVTEASHLVTDRIRRTVKFLCALGKGIPILSLDWLHQSRKAGHFLPPDEYVVTDPEQEKNFGFRLRDALSRAQERRLLEGYEIHVTPGVQPPPPQMGEIISCCGGTVLSNMPRSYKPQRVVITCPQDFPRCSIPSRLGLPLLSPEFLLTGVLKQEAKPEDFVLSSLEISST